MSEGASVALDGSASSDPDGTIASYAWAQTGGPAVSLSGASSAKATFVAPTLTATADLAFKLTVTDNAGASASAMVTITVTFENTAPGTPPDAGREVGPGDAGAGTASGSRTSPGAGPFATGCSSARPSDLGMGALALALGALWRRRRNATI
jgi:MYXO-CTERM domain-containing protein